MPTITIPDKETVQLGRIGKLEIEWSRIPQNILDHIWKVHAPQYFTDAANSGGKDATAAERTALAQKKLDACYAGELRARMTSQIPVDPFEAECYKIAYNDIIAGLRQFWKDVPKGTKDQPTFVINRERAKRGLPATTMHDMIGERLTKHVKDIERRAKENLQARAAVDIFG